MSTTTLSTGQPEPASAPATNIPSVKPDDSSPPKMGVASLATKRHLTPSPIEGDEVVSAKIAKLNNNNNDNSINNNTGLTTEGIVDGVILGEHQIATQILQTNGSSSGGHHGQENGHVGSTELVTTSILARTLLTSGGGGTGGPSPPAPSSLSASQGILQYSSCHSNGTTTHLDPLESLKSSLEALPAPAIIDHSPVGGSGGVYSSNKTISQASNNTDPLSSFASLLGPDHHHHHHRQHHHNHHHHLANSVLSPIDPIIEVDPLEWNNPAKATPVPVGGVNDHLTSSHHHHHHQGMHPSITSLTSLVDHQLLSNSGPGSPHEVITEDENGKSYFNLGAAQDSTILARKSSTSSQGSLGGGPWGSSSCGGGDQQNGGCNGGGNDFDDAISSSSCDSISSEDLFNSGEEFDASDDDDDDDEDELCTYKQQRSTVLHLSLCKLNKFRTNCVEPSLHRSVLICNTLRHIEQEIRNEDAEAASNSSSPSSSSSSSPEENLKSRERLPSFWPAPPAQQQPQQNPSLGGFSPNLPPGSPNGSSSQQSQPQITDTRPGLNGGLMLGGGPMGGLPSLLGPPSMLPPVPSGGGNGTGHDPYLTPNPYNDAPYLSAYDYNSPRPTPFHTTSYDYEQDLLLPPPPNTSPSTSSSTNGTTSISTQGSVSSLSDVGSINGGSSSLLECDSGYSDADLDMGLSSYYYSSPLPPPPVPPSNSHLSSTPQTTSEFSVSSSSIVSSTSSLCSSSAIISSTSSPLTSTSPSYHHHHQSYHLPPSQHHHQLAPPPPPPPSAHDLGGPSPPSCAQPVAPMEITEQELSSCSSGDICEITSNTLTSPSTSLPVISSTSSTSSSHHGASCDYSMASSSITTTSSGGAATTAPSSSSSSGGSEEHQCSSSTSPSPPPSPPGHQSSCSQVSSTSSSQVTCSSATAIATSCCTSSTNVVSSSPQPPTSTSPSPPTFAQQDSQCGLESRRSDMSRNVGNHYNNHHTMPMMDSLISPAYSSSSL